MFKIATAFSTELLIETLNHQMLKYNTSN